MESPASGGLIPSHELVKKLLGTSEAAPKKIKIIKKKEEGSAAKRYQQNQDEETTAVPKI